MISRVALASLKAIAAFLAVLIGSGIVTGHWATDSQLIESAITAVVTWLTPNVVYPVTRTTAPAPAPAPPAAP